MEIDDNLKEGKLQGESYLQYYNQMMMNSLPLGSGLQLFGNPAGAIGGYIAQSYAPYGMQNMILPTSGPYDSDSMNRKLKAAKDWLKNRDTK